VIADGGLAFGVWRLAFGVWRLAFGVRRSAFGVQGPGISFAQVVIRIQNPTFCRMGARAVDWARLESVCTERYRGFESRPIRRFIKLLLFKDLYL
jgi:hypothetical protein